MPPAIAIPVALAGASMIASNVQQKSAAKNNQTQQQAAVNNAQQASQTAQNNFNAWEGAHPAPYAGGAIIAAPRPGAYGGGSPITQQVMQPAPVPRQPMASNPNAVEPLVRQILRTA